MSIFLIKKIAYIIVRSLLLHNNIYVKSFIILL